MRVKRLNQYFLKGCFYKQKMQKFGDLLGSCRPNTDILQISFVLCALQCLQMIHHLLINIFFSLECASSVSHCFNKFYLLHPRMQ